MGCGAGRHERRLLYTTRLYCINKKVVLVAGVCGIAGLAQPVNSGVLVAGVCGTSGRRCKIV